MAYHPRDIQKEHKHGTIALKPDTLLSITRELCDEIHRNGFDKILIVNWHGGGHADLREAAMAMAIDEKLVHPELFKAEETSSTHKADYLSNAGISRPSAWAVNFPNSADSYPPIGCSKAIGEAMLRINAERLADIIRTIKCDDGFCVKMSNNRL